MKTGYQVGDAMTKKPVNVGSSATIEECAQIMRKEHVGALLVKDNNELRGILSEQDIVRKLVAEGRDLKKTTVGEAMVTKLATITPDKDIYDALAMMRNMNIRHLPVMDGKKMVGLLTMKDVLKIEPQLFDILVEKFEIREMASKPAFGSKAAEGICQTCGKYSGELSEVDGAMVCPDCREEQE